MARDPTRPQARASSELVLIVPAAVGAVSIVVCVAVLPALAGPHILAEAGAARYATGIWLFHVLMFLVMGFAGAGGGGRRGVAVATCLTGIFGAVAGLFYTQAGILPASTTTVGGMTALALALGLAGALAGRAVPGYTGWLVAGLTACGIVVLGVAFLRTGTVSGTVTRPVHQITFGMMTAQKDVPVPGIPVVLTTPDGETRLYEAKTGDTGGYVLNGPRPGRYKLFAQDVERGRGDGAWVSVEVTVHSHLSGLGVGAGHISLPMYRDEQASPFLEAGGQGPLPDDPASRAARTGGGVQGQMRRQLDEATGGQQYDDLE